MAEGVIEVEGLGKRYPLGPGAPYVTLRDVIAGMFRSRRRLAPEREPRDHIWALRDVSFEVERGEVVGIVGRNGAGKSTLLKILSRITPPTEGAARVRGRVASLLEVGTGFHPELSGRENIYLNGAILGMRRDEIDRQFDEIVAFAELADFVETPVKHYSTGMYVRLGFAVAAHLQPEILIVDEVLAVGDAAFQKKCLGKLGSVARQGRTVIFVSHNLGAVTALCTRAIELADGRVQAVGPAGEVVAAYLSRVLEDTSEGLEQARLAGYGADVRFTDVRLHAADGSTIPFGSTIGYELGLSSRIDVGGLTIASSVFNALGVCVGTVFTTEPFALAAGERVRIRLGLSRLELAPGSYYAGFSVGWGGIAGDRRDLDIVIGKPAFQVLPILREGDPTARWNAQWGSVVLREAELRIERG